MSTVLKRIVAALSFDVEDSKAEAFEKRLETVEAKARRRVAAVTAAANTELKAIKKTDTETEAAYQRRVKAAERAAAKQIRAARTIAEEEAKAIKATIALEQKAEKAADQRQAKAMDRLKKVTGFIDAQVTRVAKLTAQGAVAIGGLAVHATANRQSQIGRLQGITGGPEAAAAEFERLRRFGRDSKIGTEGAVGAFTKLGGLGVRNDNEAITGLANIAAGTGGKSTSDMVEAVADAATFEFERLKEFGIKASQQGDKVALTFRGVTTTIDKDAKAITDYLVKIGNTEFAGAVQRQGETLGGTFNMLRDQADDFLIKVGQEGLAAAVQEAAKELGVMADGGDNLAQTLGKALATGFRSLFGIVKSGIPIVAGFIQLVAKIIEFFGGAGGLITALAAGKVALMAINAALAATTMQSAAAATAMRGMALAGGALGVALAGAALIIGHTEKKIAELEARSAKMAAGIRKSRMDMARTGWDDSNRGDQMRRLRAEIETGRDSDGHKLSDEAIDDAREELAIHVEQDTAGFQTPEAQAQLERQRQREANIARGQALAKESPERKRLKQKLRERSRKVGGTDEAGFGALKQYDEQISKGYNPDVALEKAFEHIDTHAGVKKKGGGGRRRAKKKGDKPEMTTDEMLERDFGAGIAGGGGPVSHRPSLGTTINKIDQSVRIDHKMEVNVAGSVSGDPHEAGMIAAKAATTEINKVWGQLVDHFNAVRTT